MAKFKYRVHLRNGETVLCTNVREVGKYLKVSSSVVTKIVNGSGYYGEFQVEKLGENFTVDKPNVGDDITIEGIECRVTHVYGRTFAVSSSQGVGTVRFTDMKLVSPLSFHGAQGSNLKLRRF